jgi:hypothetical protein
MAASVSDSREEGSRRGGSHPHSASASGGATWCQEEGSDVELGQSWAEVLGGLVESVGRRDEKSRKGKICCVVNGPKSTKE